MIRSNKIRKSAKGEDCTLNVPGYCNFNPETVVWCHSPFMEHGHGVGLKAHDTDGCYGCSGCHFWLDTDSKRLGVPKHERELTYYRGHSRSMRRLIEKGIVVLA